MILRGTDDTLFELEVVGYQFPHMENDEYGYDAQWQQFPIRVGALVHYGLSKASSAISHRLNFRSL
jgi:hypothetical protein